MTGNIPIRKYVNNIENRITFKIKARYYTKYYTRYYTELLTQETMKLLQNTKNKITENWNCQNMFHLDITEVVLVHCDTVINDYQQGSRVLSHIRRFYEILINC